MINESLTIKEVSEQIGRTSHTIRQWEREGVLPQNIVPNRDKNNHRFWTQEQVELIKIWIQKEER